MAQRTQMAIEWSAVVAAVALVVTLIVTLRRAPAGQVAGHHHRAALVPLGQQREQHLGLVRALLYVAEVV